MYSIAFAVFFILINKEPHAYSQSTNYYFPYFNEQGLLWQKGKIWRKHEFTILGPIRVNTTYGTDYEIGSTNTN